MQASVVPNISEYINSYRQTNIQAINSLKNLSITK